MVIYGQVVAQICGLGLPTSQRCRFAGCWTLDSDHVWLKRPTALPLQSPGPKVLHGTRHKGNWGPPEITMETNGFVKPPVFGKIGHEMVLSLLVRLFAFLYVPGMYRDSCWQLHTFIFLVERCWRNIHIDIFMINFTFPYFSTFPPVVFNHVWTPMEHVPDARPWNS